MGNVRHLIRLTIAPPKLFFNLEPIYYSTVDDKAPENLNPKPDPVYNVLEANDSTMQAPSDPVYNVLERSAEESKIQFTLNWRASEAVGKVSVCDRCL